MFIAYYPFQRIFTFFDGRFLHLFVSKHFAIFLACLQHDGENCKALRVKNLSKIVPSQR